MLKAKAIVQGIMWLICLAVILLGGLIFLVNLANSHNPLDRAAVGAVATAFFLGAYVLARAAEKLAAAAAAIFAPPAPVLTPGPEPAQPARRAPSDETIMLGQPGSRRN